jgi:AcrR family transcriptional regulator
MTRIVKNPIERRKEIIEVARKLFLDFGYEKTTMNEVISTLGVAKGTVYHYFKSKEDLLDAVVENMSDEYVEIVKNRMVNNKKSAIERFYKLVKASNITDKTKETINKLHQFGNIGLHVRLLALCVKKIAPLYAEIIQQGCKEGVFKTDHPLETAEIFLSGIQFITDIGFYPWSQNDILRRTEALSFLAEAQLGAKKGTLNLLNQI